MTTAGKGKVNEWGAALGAEFKFDLTVTSVHMDVEEEKKVVLTANGIGSLPEATRQAYSELGGKLLVHVNKNKEYKDKKAAEQKDRHVPFNPTWIATTVQMLSPMLPIKEVTAQELQDFIGRALQEGEQKMGFMFPVGVDTEGQKKTSQRDYSHPKWMQISAGVHKETVVFRLNMETWAMAEKMFAHPRVTVCIVGAAKEMNELAKAYGTGTPMDFGNNIKDVQEMAKTVMQMQGTAVPSLAKIISFLRKMEHPGEDELNKFMLHDISKKDLAYEAFESMDQAPLKVAHLLYAGLDAALAVYAYIHLADEFASLQEDKA